MSNGLAGTYARERRDVEAARAASRRRERDALAVAVLLALPLVTYVLARSGLSRIESVGIAGFFGVLLVAWRRGAAASDTDRVERWAAGAWGEEATARALESVADRHTAVFHDVVLPGRAGNIDHVVVGRGGVVIVETKRWKGTVVVGRHVRADGERRDEVVDQVLRLRRALSRSLGGVPVDGFACIHARRVRRAWFRLRPEIDDIRFGGPDAMVRWLRRRRRTSTKAEARALVEQVATLVGGGGLESRMRR